MTWDPRWEEWLEKIQLTATTLTEWEATFIESVRDRIERHHALSPKQAEILERIYAEKTP